MSKGNKIMTMSAFGGGLAAVAGTSFYHNPLFAGIIMMASIALLTASSHLANR